MISTSETGHDPAPSSVVARSRAQLRASWGFWVAWHVLAAAAVGLIPGRLRGTTLWELEDRTLVLAVGAALTYLLIVGVWAVLARYRERVRAGELVAIACVFLTVFLAGLAFYRPVYSRSAVAGSVFLVIALAALPLLARTRVRRIALAGLSVAVIAAVASSGPKPASDQTIIRTEYYTLLATYYRQPFEVQQVVGGALARLHDHLLLATGDGQLFAVRLDSVKGGVTVRRLPHRVPMNRDEFIRGARPDSYAAGTFRTADVLVQEKGDDVRLFASHHYWHSKRGCFTVRVSEAAGTYTALVGGGAPQRWRTVYESQPCLPLKKKGHVFGGHQVGGRLQQLDENTLLIALGDHERDGVWSDDMISQDPAASYGKTVLIDLLSGNARQFTLGHRNPQGLQTDATGRVWLTEHGPRGGDELNLISEGKNYGWPLVTYGTNYGEVTWPLNRRQGSHDGYEGPVFTWTPSIGISSLLDVRSNLLDLWRGDLLIGSLREASIWRVRLHHEQVVSTERIAVGERIRDLVEDQGGRLVLWTERGDKPPTAGALVVIEPVLNGKSMQGLLATSSGRGQVAFVMCAGCHSVTAGDSHGLAPTLRGIAGRRVASVPGYTYSDALKSLSGNWTEERLNAFLSDPQRFAPGTAMQAGGMPDGSQRSDLIAYLKSLK
jgi:aldose sugar dehydrogenase